MSKTSHNKKQLKIEYIDFVQQLRQTKKIKPPDCGPYGFISDQLNLVDLMRLTIEKKLYTYGLCHIPIVVSTN